MGVVIAVSGTVASVVDTLVMTFGALRAGVVLARVGRVGGVAGLGDVDLVAVPEQVVALGCPAGVCVIRRGQALSARRETVCIGLPPSHLSPGRGVGPEVVLQEDNPQYVNSG
jgi:hypothetical protein